MIVASCTGAIFGERIIHCPKPYKVKTFFIGFFMVIASLPVFDLGFVFIYERRKCKFTILIPTAEYGLFLPNRPGIQLYSVWYCTRHWSRNSSYVFTRSIGIRYPGYLSTEKKISETPDSPVEKNKIEHSDSVRITHR